MAQTWGNPHLQQPKQCSTNTTPFTDTTVVARSTAIKGVHITELRAAIDAELTRRHLGTTTWTDPTLSPRATTIKESYITELRTKAESFLKDGDCSADVLYCPQDTTGATAYTDPTITPRITSVKAAHINELRTRVNAFKTTCICEAEFCNYCADCGYQYQTCSFAACCNEHQAGTYNNCTPNNRYNVYICGSINLPVATEFPYKGFTTGSVSTAWDGYVPWAMCNYTPPGKNWGSCTYQGGLNHSNWDCKCNPFSWA